MASRLDLQKEFENILGSRNVYFQPPSSKKISYPCIIYSKTDVDEKRANNGLYNKTNKYKVVVIDYDPDSTIPDACVESLKMCCYDQVYTSDNLNHTVLTLYY